jgi:hypothetical protein
MEGPLAVTRPKVASRLNLDEAQLEAIQGLKWEFQLAQEQLRESQIERLRADAGRPRAARPGPGANPQPTDPSTPDRTLDEVNLRMNREADELRARLPQRLGKILTRRQRDAFNRMLGAPFDPKQAP